MFVKPDKLGSVHGLKHTSKDGEILMSTQNVAKFEWEQNQIEAHFNILA